MFKNVKSVKRKISLCFAIGIVVCALVLSVSSALMSVRASRSTLNTAIVEVATVAADKVSYQLKLYTSVAREIANAALLADPATSTEEKLEFLNKKAVDYDYLAGGFIDKNGISVTDGTDVSGQAFAQEALGGKTYISPPIINDQLKTVNFVVTAPVWKDNVEGTEVVGAVLFTMQEGFLNDIVTAVNVGESGSAYMIDSTGTVIAHKDMDLVLTRDNSNEQAKTDSRLAAIAAIEADLMAGNTGVGSYTWAGVNKTAAYAPIPGTNGWGIAITTKSAEFEQAAYTGVYVSVAELVALTVLGVIIANTFGKSIAKPVAIANERLELLSQGDLKTPVPTSDAKDETARLLNDLQTTITRLTSAIEDTESHLGYISEGDFTHEVTREYHGDLKALEVSTKKILDGLNKYFSQIDNVSNMVAAGADQVASGAQALAQGATEQAASVEELSASLNNISNSVAETAKLTKRADELAMNVGNEIENSNKQMDGMIAAMDDISNSSEQIGRIIKTIEDIAFQTNILALNAAVEAARAGEAGKGFAVVADEVRNLASKSAEAAKNTTDLIGGSIRAVQNGVKIADDTYKSLSQVVEGAKEVSSVVQQISEATEFETEAIFQTTQGIDQISNVVQVTSATAEESAAASEELSGQAAQLRSLLGALKLKDEQ